MQFKIIRQVSRVLLLSFSLSLIATGVEAQSDEPASKKDAEAVVAEFAKFKNASRAKSWSSPETFIRETDYPQYAVLLQQLKTLDSTGLAKLSLGDKFFIIAMRRTHSPAAIWMMNEKDLVKSAFATGFEHTIYFGDITLGPEIIVSGTSTSKVKIFKADLLYKGTVFETKAIVCIREGKSYFIPTREIRELYLNSIGSTDMHRNGLSEEKFIVERTKKISTREEHTYLWDPNVSLEYWSNNKRRASRVYKSGKAHGTTKEYDSDGILTAKLEYQSGHLHGLQLYYEDSKLHEERTYDDGEPVGLHKEYFESGKIEKTMSYRDGKMLTYKVYYEAGGVKFEETDDYRIIYYPSGKKESEGEMDQFGRNGVWKFYNEEGKLIKEQGYRIGNPYGPEKKF